MNNRRSSSVPLPSKQYNISERTLKTQKFSGDYSTNDSDSDNSDSWSNNSRSSSPVLGIGSKLYSDPKTKIYSEPKISDDVSTSENFLKEPGKFHYRFIFWMIVLAFIMTIGSRYNEINYSDNNKTKKNKTTIPKPIKQHKIIDWWSKYINECCLSDGLQKKDCSANDKCWYTLRGLISVYDQTSQESLWLNRCCYENKAMGTTFDYSEKYCSFSCLNKERLTYVTMIN